MAKNSDVYLGLLNQGEIDLGLGRVSFPMVNEVLEKYLSSLVQEAGVPDVRPDQALLTTYWTYLSGYQDHAVSIAELRAKRNAVVSNLNASIGRAQALSTTVPKRLINTVAPIKTRLDAAIRANAPADVIATLRKQYAQAAERALGGAKAALGQATSSGAPPDIIKTRQEDYERALKDENEATGSKARDFGIALALLSPIALAWWCCRK